MKHIIASFLLAGACCGAGMAQETIPLDAAHWKELGGKVEYREGTAELSAEGQGSSILLNDTKVYDFELSMEVNVKDAVVAMSARAHFAPDAVAGKKGVFMGTPGLFGPLVMAGSGQVGMLVANLKAGRNVETIRGTLPEGEWHKLRVQGQGGHWRVWVDDQPVGEADDESFIGGGIAITAAPLQETPETHVQVRNVQLKDNGRAGKWTPLFNGTDLSGWKEWGEEKWTVENGAIYGRSGEKKSEGYLATEKTWKDFRVRGQFQMLGEGNFGLFFHSTITLREDGFPVIAGVQGEVEPGYPSSTGWVYESYKRGWLVEPPKNTLAAYVLDPKGWNEIEIQSHGNHLTTWVNGVRALDFEDPAPNLTEGSFALQLHTGGVDGIAWKDIYAAEE